MSEDSRQAGTKKPSEPRPVTRGATTRDIPKIYEFGAFRLEPEERKLLRGDEMVALTPKAFDLLVLLVQNSGHLLEKDELIGTLWPDSFVEDGNLTNNIFLLRKALGEESQYIETVPKRGYRFVGAVRQLPNAAPPKPEKPADGPRQLVNEASTERRPPDVAQKPARWPIVAGLLLVAICAAAGALGYRRWRGPESPPLNAVPLTALPGWVDFPAISPDGTRVAFEWNGEQQFTTFDLYVKTIGNENLLRLTKDPAVHLAPTWSPDGKQIAFQRVSKDEGGIYVVPAQGGPVKKLRSTHASFDRSMRISWSPDGKTIAFADSPFAGGHKRLQLLSLETLESTPIEHDEHCVEEILPAFSPDGKQLAYACSLSSREGEFGLSVATADGRVPRIIKESSGWLKGLEWQVDGKSLLFAEGHTGVEHEILRQVNIADGSVWDRMIDADSPFSDAFSARAGRLAYVVNSSGHHNIWRGDLLRPDAPPMKLITTTRDQFCPRYSPDGKHIAFASNRGGPLEIWMSDADGQDIVQLTNLKSLGAGSLTWSPDSRKIAFDSRAKTPEGQIRPDVYIVDITERAPKKLDTGTPGASQPNWSHDGKSIYFLGGSHDAAGERIYRVPTEGGKPEVLTTARGYWPLESQDRKTLYFAENSGTSFTLHMASLDPTGTETQIEGMPTLSFLLNWEVVPGGVYFFPMDDHLTLNYFEFSTKKVHRLFKVGGGGAFLGISVSPDGRYILYPEFDDYRSDIMLVENFR